MGVALRKIGGAKRKRRSVALGSRIPERDHRFWYADCGSCKSGSTRRSEAAGQALGGPNRPETSKNESKRNRSTQKIFRIRGGRAAELPPAHTRGLQLGGVTCGTQDRRSRAPDTRHYLLMACRVGGPNLVANSAGFEIYKSVLRKSTVLYPPASHTVRLESINLLSRRTLPDFRWGGRNGNDDRNVSSQEFRIRIADFGTLSAPVVNLAAPADPRPQGRLRGAQTG